MANHESNSTDEKVEARPLRLAELEPFGVGGRRRCFVHPEYPGRCVKVLRTDPHRVVRLGKSAWWPAAWRRKYDNNADELRQLSRLRRKLGEELMARHFPRVYGMAPTDLGPGLVLDLVRNADGQISLSLREELANGTKLAEIRAAFNEFGRFLVAHGIVTRELLDHNLAVRRDADGGCVFFLIDGFGDSAWLPLGRLVPGHNRRRIQKKLTKAWARFEKLEANLADPEKAKTAIKWRVGFLRHR